jgi:hypothetical protein
VSAWLSLFGAYFPPGEPLATKSFVVDLYSPHGFSTVLRGGLAIPAHVSAEGLAHDSAATARLSLGFPGLLCRLTFSSDEGRAHEAVLAARFGRRILRAFTELSGTMCGPDGTTFGVRLRLNWRALRSGGNREG